MLPGDYIAGLVDGEGCFSLRLHKDIKRNRPGSPTYYFWKTEFCIFMRSDDKAILQEIQQTLNCGKVYITGRFARFSVQDRSDLISKIIPFFLQYPLRAKKKYDFELWVRALNLINNSAQRSVVPRDDKLKDALFEEIKGISNLLSESRLFTTP